MKKIISLTLVLLMLLASFCTLTACGDDKPEEGKKNDPKKEEQKEEEKKEEPDNTVPYYDDIAEDTADDIF